MKRPTSTARNGAAAPTGHAAGDRADGAAGDALAGAADATVGEAVDRYAVIGNPIAHSRSPAIHALFAAQTGQRLRYERLLAPLDGFAAAVDRLRAEGGLGANVTVPFKLEACRYAHELSARARAAGAVNTLGFEGARVWGDNTDGAGLLRDIERLVGALAGARVLLLGAGGAARGVLQPLLAAGVEQVTVANRTLARAQELVEVAGSVGPARMAACALGAVAAGGALAHERFDLVINATSSGLAGEAPAVAPALLSRARLAYDMVYGAEPTAFVQAARAGGCELACDGLGMLVEQAAESFAAWRGVRPDTAPVLAAMRAALASEAAA